VNELSIEVVNLTRLALEPGEVALLVAGVLSDEGVSGAELGVHFVGARRMRGLNRDFRGHDEVTDVLSFPLEDDDDREPPAGPKDDAEPPRLLGDVVVCPVRAAAQARGAGVPLAHEIAALLVHGTLHVLGYDHETDAGEMAARQDELLGASNWERLLAQD